jgi:hypothetical protein
MRVVSNGAPGAPCRTHDGTGSVPRPEHPLPSPAQFRTRDNFAKNHAHPPTPRQSGHTVSEMRTLLVLAALGPHLTAPVPGTVARGFEYAGDPYARGHHRGVDLAANPGTAVRAACSGRVTFAGRAGANGRAVTIRCGTWSVTHLPLRDLAVRAGAHTMAGAPIGTVGASPPHAGLHLGVRRATDPHGYIDPTPLLHSPPRHAPPAAPRPTPRRSAPPPPNPAPLPSTPPARLAPPRAGPSTPPARFAPPRAGPSTPSARFAPLPPPGTKEKGSSPLAPWPAWAGLALLLTGATGAGAARRARGRRVAVPETSAVPVR